jgi:peptidoglycan/LPS O-acetylase OafA/YrhL
MKNNVLTKYLAVFLLLCLVFDGVLLCFFADKPWWNNWMIMGPNLYMVLGAFYCHLMKKNIHSHPNKLTWLLVYKGIKIALTVAAMVLYIVFVKESAKAFVIITASAYLIALVAETCVYNHYIKNLNKEIKE